MAKSSFVLDTNAVIFLTTKGNTISIELQKALDESDLFISAITEIELFAKPTILPDEEEKLYDFISNNLHVVDLTSEVKKETIALRRTNKLKLPDCIVAATAIISNAILLTADRDLLGLKWPGYSAEDIKS